MVGYPEPHLIIMKDTFEIELPWYLEPIIARASQKKPKRQLHRCSLKHCLRCKKNWQYDYSSNKKKFVQYDDMPSYGIHRATCDKCKKKEGYLYEI